MKISVLSALHYFVLCLSLLLSCIHAKTRIFTPNATICQSFFSSSEISCPDGYAIKIVNATFGRTSSSICLTTPASSVSNTNCVRNETDAISSICNGNNVCSFSSLNLSDSCPGTSKYLTTKGYCIGCSGNCSSCNQPNTCTTCQDGYFLDQTCLPCSNACKTCTNLTYCNSCPSGEYLFQGHCNKTCPTGIYKSQGTCVAACPNGTYLAFDTCASGCSWFIQDSSAGSFLSRSLTVQGFPGYIAGKYGWDGNFVPSQVNSCKGCYLACLYGVDSLTQAHCESYFFGSSAKHSFLTRYDICTPNCKDVPGWKDSKGSCSYYDAHPLECANAYQYHTFSSVRATDACCTCGGSSLFSTEASVASRKIWGGNSLNCLVVHILILGFILVHIQ